MLNWLLVTGDVLGELSTSWENSGLLFYHQPRITFGQLLWIYTNTNTNTCLVHSKCQWAPWPITSLDPHRLPVSQERQSTLSSVFQGKWGACVPCLWMLSLSYCPFPLLKGASLQNLPVGLPSSVDSTSNISIGRGSFWPANEHELSRWRIWPCPLSRAPDKDEPAHQLTRKHQIIDGGHEGICPSTQPMFPLPLQAASPSALNPCVHPHALPVLLCLHVTVYTEERVICIQEGVCAINNHSRSWQGLD